MRQLENYCNEFQLRCKPPKTALTTTLYFVQQIMINDYSIPGRSLFQWHLQGNRSAAQNTDDISDQIRSAEMVHHNSAVAQIFLQQGSLNRH